MNLPSRTFAIAMLVGAASWFASSADAAPLGAPLGLQDAAGASVQTSPVQTVQWRGGRGWGGGWHGGHGWWGGPAAGFAAGAVVGGALAASQPWYGYDYDYAPGYYGYGYDPGYYDNGYVAPGGYVEEAAPGRDVAYCMQRYRSYDPPSGTYLGYDGLRHPCP